MKPIFSLFDVNFSSFIFFNSLAFLSAYIIVFIRYKKFNFSNKEYLVAISFITFGGFIGSKVFYIFEEFDTFMKSPVNIFFSFEGSGFFGGFILVLLCFELFYKNTEKSVLNVLDAIIICVPVGIIFGRTGCFFAGDGCYGPPTSMPWGMTFPEGVMPTHIPVHPTQLYEIMINLIIVVIILRLENKLNKAGETLGLYVLLSGLTRFIIEFYRINIEVVYGLSAQQLISFGFVFLGLYLLRYKLKGFKKPIHSLSNQ